MRPSRHELYRRLRFRPSGAGGDAFDAELWAEAGAEATILVVDLSGFTRLTRSHGVLQFLAVHADLIEVVAAEARRTGGWMVKSEADNAIVAFLQPSQAAAMGLELVAQARAMNLNRDAKDHVVPCIGIAHGRVLLLSDDVYGDAVNVAYKLGEDVAGPFAVLVEQGTARTLAQAGFILGSADRVVCGGVELVYHPLVPTGK